MTPNADPWKTLGLSPGAPADEVRRAYRRLAKINHPDAAGETALPRFLAIQAAYEQLAGGRRRPGARPSARPTPPEPWRADPDRARASGRTAGRTPGARPGPGPSPGSEGGGSSTAGRGWARGDGARPNGGRPGRTSADQPGDGAETSTGAGSPAGPGSGGAPRARRPSSRRRAANKATPYSTSYDAADDEPFEPGWSGATWYGASSGTYWTINPKEYADPRKHGPEYQRRARRSATGWIIDDEPEDGNAPERGDSPEPAAASGPGPSDDAAPGGDELGADRDQARPRPGPARSRSTHRDTPDAWPQPPPPTSPPPTRASSATADSARRPSFHALIEAPSTGLGRLGVALLGWPPLGLAAANAIGESTGCGRFAASCGDLSAPGTWLVQVAIVVLLLALPRLAAWSVHGSIAALVVGLPSAVVLSAGGGARQPDASTSVLAAVIALAWITGVAYAAFWPIVARWRSR